MRAITEIIVHCTATKEGREYSISELRAWHRSRGWKDVGYHYVIHNNGIVEPGRPLIEMGAHCQGHNRNSIGIAYIGGLDSNGNPKDTRTNEQKTSLTKLISRLCFTYPIKVVAGHHDYDKGKACPCFDAKAEYSSLIK